MTPEDVIDVLSKAGAYDNRTIGHVEVAAWHELVGRYERGDALEAVGRHYTETRERMMPADLIKQIKAVREDRRREQHSDALALPSRWEEDPERDERFKANRARLEREILGPLAEKRSVDRALREERTTADIEESRARYLLALEGMRAKETAGLINEVLANAPAGVVPIDADGAAAAVAYVRHLEAQLARQPIDDKETTRS